MRIGIATTDFPQQPLIPLFDKIKRLGFGAVQLSLASLSESGFTPDGRIELAPSIDEGLLDDINAAAKAYGLAIVSLNGTFNSAHPDPAVRDEGIRRIELLAHAANRLNCGIITLCSGTRNADNLWAFHPDNASNGAWNDMIASMRRMCEIAQRHNVILAVEPEAANIVDTPERARRMLDEVASPNLKMIIDCANLFRPGEAKRENAAARIRFAFDCFGENIALAHGKDIRESDGIDFCATGEGIVDFPLFLRLLKEAAPPCDMILHGIYDETKMPAGIEVIRSASGKAGGDAK